MGDRLAAAWACVLRIIKTLEVYVRSAASLLACRARASAQYSQRSSKEMWRLTLEAVIRLKERAADAASSARGPMLQGAACVRVNTLGAASDFTLDYVETFSDPDLRERIEAAKASRARAAREEEARRLNAARWEAGKCMLACVCATHVSTCDVGPAASAGWSPSRPAVVEGGLDKLRPETQL